ncbi:helix-turn-helix domain-containing protein [Candidatus Parcubacteria bacterium]|nr:helix-turn-helix domain-containing protein [Candidatus Parcubacteria bacterium]
MGKSEQPHKVLGEKIKSLREKWQQTVDEVSTTLEIDEKELKQIESGKILPNDNLLDMIINHFLLSEEQALELRAMATVPKDTAIPESLLAGGIEDMLMKQVVMYLPVDNRVVYTDSMNATVNKHGMVLQFMQSQNGKPVSVSQVGMSREHAERMLKVIKTTLEKYDKSQETKLLSAPKTEKQNDENKTDK